MAICDIISLVDVVVLCSNTTTYNLQIMSSDKVSTQHCKGEGRPSWCFLGILMQFCRRFWSLIVWILHITNLRMSITLTMMPCVNVLNTIAKPGHCCCTCHSAWWVYSIQTFLPVGITDTLTQPFSQNLHRQSFLAATPSLRQTVPYIWLAQCFRDYKPTQRTWHNNSLSFLAPGC